MGRRGPGDSRSPSEVGSVDPVWSPGLEVRSLEIALRSDAQAAEGRAKEQDLEDGVEQSKKALGAHEKFVFARSGWMQSESRSTFCWRGVHSLRVFVAAMKQSCF